MNDLEFREQYKRLTDVHPNHFQKDGPNSENTLKELDVDWFRQVAGSIVMSNESSSGEIRHRLCGTFLKESKKISSVRWRSLRCWRWMATNDEARARECFRKYGAENLSDALRNHERELDEKKFERSGEAIKKVRGRSKAYARKQVAIKISVHSQYI